MSCENRGVGWISTKSAEGKDCNCFAAEGMDSPLLLLALEVSRLGMVPCGKGREI